MIQQKAAELLMSVPASKRSLKDMQKAIEQASHGQKSVFFLHVLHRLLT